MQLLAGYLWLKLIFKSYQNAKSNSNISQKVKSFIKDTNDFLKKLNELRDLPDEFILCTIDVVGLYPNIPQKEGLEAVRKALNKREVY